MAERTYSVCITSSRICFRHFFGLVGSQLFKDLASDHETDGGATPWTKFQTRSQEEPRERLTMQRTVICADFSGCIRRSLSALGAEVRSLFEDIMSVTQEADTTDEENRITKTVTLVGYVPDGYDSLRSFADDISDLDMFNQVQEKSITYKLVMPFGGVKEIDKDQYEKLREADTGEIGVTKDSHEWLDDEYRDYHPFREKVKAFSNEVVDEIGTDEDIYSKSYSAAIMSDESGFKIRPYSSSDETPLLKHQQEITPDDMYVEDSEEIPCFKLKVKLKDVPESKLEHIEEVYLKELQKRFVKEWGFERVRLAGCRKETVERWTCLNV